MKVLDVSVIQKFTGNEFISAVPVTVRSCGRNKFEFSLCVALLALLSKQKKLSFKKSLYCKKKLVLDF